MDCTSPTLEAALAAERAHCGTLPAHLRERQLIGTVLWAPPRSCTLPCMVAAYGNASSAPSSPRRRHRHGWEKVEVVGWSSFTALAASQPYDVCYLWSRHQPRGTNVAWSAERFDECLLVSTSRLSTAAVALSSPPPLRSPGLVRRKMQGDEICDESFRRRAIEDEWVRPECDFAAAAAFSHGAKGERARAVLDWRRWVGIDVGVKQRSTRCSWCGRTDHLRRNSRACPFYAGYGATAAARRRDKARALAKQALPREDEDEDDEASSAGGGVTTPPAAAAAQSAARLAGKRKRRRRDGVMACLCGSFDHRRRSSHLCPLNHLTAAASTSAVVAPTRKKRTKTSAAPKRKRKASRLVGKAFREVLPLPPPPPPPPPPPSSSSPTTGPTAPPTPPHAVATAAAAALAQPTPADTAARARRRREARAQSFRFAKVEAELLKSVGGKKRPSRVCALEVQLLSKMAQVERSQRGLGARSVDVDATRDRFRAGERGIFAPPPGVSSLLSPSLRRARLSLTHLHLAWLIASQLPHSRTRATRRCGAAFPTGSGIRPQGPLLSVRQRHPSESNVEGLPFQRAVRRRGKGGSGDEADAEADEDLALLRWR